MTQRYRHDGAEMEIFIDHFDVFDAHFRRLPAGEEQRPRAEFCLRHGHHNQDTTTLIEAQVERFSFGWRRVGSAYDYINDSGFSDTRLMEIVDAALVALNMGDDPTDPVVSSVSTLRDAANKFKGALARLED